MTRALLPGQRADLCIIDVDTAQSTLRLSSDTLLFEAPNWSPDGQWLVVNGGGQLFRLGVEKGGLEEINLGEIAEINNDHVISPDGTTVYVSSEDGHIYAVDLEAREGTRTAPRRVTNNNAANFKHYLHGVSPDGRQLASIGLALIDGKVQTNVHVVPSAGGPDMQLTEDHFLDDGSEFSPDGLWIYFNSERGSTKTGHAQLFRIPAPGSQRKALSLNS